MGTASTTSTAINLTKTIIGAGMLALPYAYRAQGIVLATSTLVISALTVSLGLYFQTYCSGFVAKGQASFFAISKQTYPSLAVVFDIAIAVKCFGVAVSYLVIIANLMPLIAGYFGAPIESVFASRLAWLIVTMFIVGPLSFLRSLDALKYTSIVALVSSAYLVVIVVGHYIIGDTIAERGPISVWEPESFSKILTTLPIIVFAFTCAQNMFASLNEMKKATMARVTLVIAICLTTCTAIYILVGLTGYLSFGNYVGDNIISMYRTSFTTAMGQIAIVILVLFSYPLAVHPSRASFYNVIAALRHHPEQHIASEGEPLLGPVSSSDETPATTPATPLMTDKEFVRISWAILLASFAIAAVVHSLEVVLSFVGATGATALSFILPGIFTYSLAGSDKANRLIELSIGQRRLFRGAAIALVVWGFAVMFLCLGFNIYRLL